MHRVLIEPADYQSCRPAVEKAFALFAPPVRGKKVLVKPNVLRAARPEEAVTTHPAVLRAVVDKALCIACFCCQEMCPEKAIALVAGQVAG